jgi:hypothetical protein
VLGNIEIRIYFGREGDARLSPAGLFFCEPGRVENDLDAAGVGGCGG